MRKPIALLVGLLVGALLVFRGVLGAQGGHDNMLEKRITDKAILVSDVRIGSTVLPAGEYKVMCNTQTVSFRRAEDNALMFEAPCHGKALDAPSKDTVVVTDLDRNGKRVVQKLYLKGSTVEHVFDSPK